jgi:outer membrane protein, heavy metal efflux system
MTFRWFVCLPVIWLGSSSAHAEDAALTLQRVVELARTRAPSTVVAQARIDEVRAALVGARRLSTRNPVVTADAGRRWSDGTSTDLQSSLSLPLDLGGRRAKRIAVADADIRREQLEAENVQRQTVAVAVIAYYQVLHAQRRLALAEERVLLAQAAGETARQRNQTGDVPVFEVNLARGEVARAQGVLAGATGDLTRARGQLAATLGLAMASITVTGDLAERKMFESPTDRGVVRADLRALGHEAELAHAEEKLARAERWPSIDVRVSYAHERDADLLLGGLAIAVPLFDRGQGDEARAHARAKRADTEVQARTAVVATQVESARSTYDSAVTAIRVFEDQAVPLSIANEIAAAASYRAGKIDLGSLLLIRREALDTRREHLDRLLDAALAGVELWIAQGVNL